VCGIVGFVGHGSQNLLQQMTHALIHRGPDSMGEYIDSFNSVYLGHRRLIILDTVGGQQPMWNEDKTVAVIFNGEIYNHAELREKLIHRGHRFSSDHSDTEVLVHGYEEWGDAFPQQLNGMFAFAIYDKNRKRIFLARDRFGEKPLYYVCKNGAFCFASELPALAKHPSFDHRLNLRTLQKYFAYGYLPAPHTLYYNAFKLPAGSSLIYDIQKDQLDLKTYWTFQIHPDYSLTLHHEKRLVEELRHLLSQAVKSRLMSDVPLGVFLSGGLDSSAIVSALSGLYDKNLIKTFTIGFQEKSFDESSAAREIANYFGTKHYEAIFHEDSARQLTPEILARLGEPLGDASILPTYFLCRFSRKHITVALSGDGGDELFAGYDPFKALHLASCYKRIMPRAMHRGLQRLVDFLPLSSRNMSFDFKLKRALLGISYPQDIWNPVWMSLLDPKNIADVFYSPLHFEELYDEAIALWNREGAGDSLDRSLEFFTRFYLPDNILTKTDRASMMASLETRSVFLDNDLVAFCQRLPNYFKFHRGQTKYLLRKALDGALPSQILNRPKKGFGIPIAKWLRKMPNTRPDLIESMRASSIERCWQQHKAGECDHRLFLWGLMALHGSLGAQNGR